MKKLHRSAFYLALLLVVFAAACAPVKTLEVWKDPAYGQPMQKVLVIAVAQSETIRKQFENVLVNQLKARGIEGIPSYQTLPQPSAKLDRNTVVAKVQELAVDNVLVSRSIKKEEVVNHQMGGPFFAPSAVYNDGWYSFYSGSIVYPQIEYDTDYFTVATNLFALGNNKPVWSSLSQVRVQGSRQGAVNDLVPVLLQQLGESKLL